MLWCRLSDWKDQFWLSYVRYKAECQPCCVIIINFLFCRVAFAAESPVDNNKQSKQIFENLPNSSEQPEHSGLSDSILRSYSSNAGPDTQTSLVQIYRYLFQQQIITLCWLSILNLGNSQWRQAARRLVGVNHFCQFILCVKPRKIPCYWCFRLILAFRPTMGWPRQPAVRRNLPSRRQTFSTWSVRQTYNWIFLTKNQRLGLNSFYWFFWNQMSIQKGSFECLLMNSVSI